MLLTMTLYVPYDEQVVQQLLNEHPVDRDGKDDGCDVDDSMCQSHEKPKLTIERGSLDYKKAIDLAADYNCQLAERRRELQGLTEEQSSLTSIVNSQNNDIRVMENQINQIKQLYFDEVVHEVCDELSVTSDAFEGNSTRDIFLQFILQEVPMEKWKSNLLERFTPQTTSSMPGDGESH